MFNISKHQRDVLQSTGTGQDAQIAKWRQDQEKLHGTALLEKHAKEHKLDTVHRHDHPEIQNHIMERKQENEEDSDFDSEDEDLLNDPILDEVHQGAMREMRAELLRQRYQEENLNRYELMEERQALECSANNEYVVLHFHNDNFNSCKYLSGHLEELAPKYPRTKFICVDTRVSKWLTDRLKVRTLPTMVCFINGHLHDKIIGFADLGGAAEFTQSTLIRRLRSAGVVPDVHGQYLKRQARTVDLL